ncbi:MAG TPA: hypothetical protein VGT41_02740 [Candidatus Babeliales bacterium]|nr:hypothetical protein [Candidatus Babeliales bacterium]
MGFRIVCSKKGLMVLVFSLISSLVHAAATNEDVKKAKLMEEYHAREHAKKLALEKEANTPARKKKGVLPSSVAEDEKEERDQEEKEKKDTGLRKLIGNLPKDAMELTQSLLGLSMRSVIFDPMVNALLRQKKFLAQQQSSRHAFSANGKYLVGCERNPSGVLRVSIGDTASHEETQLVHEHFINSGPLLGAFSDVDAVATSSNGRYFVLGCGSNLFLYDRQRPNKLSEDASVSCSVACVAMSNDDRSVIAAFSLPETNQSRITLWSRRSKMMMWRCLLDYPVEHLFMNSGNDVVVVSGSRISILNIKTDPRAAETVLAEQDGTIATVSSDGSSIAQYARGGNVSLWDIASRQKLNRLDVCRDLQPNSIALSPDNQQVALAEDRYIHIWDLATGACVRRFVFPPDRELLRMEIAPDGRSVIARFRNESRLFKGAVLPIFETNEEHKAGIVRKMQAIVSRASRIKNFPKVYQDQMDANIKELQEIDAEDERFVESSLVIQHRMTVLMNEGRRKMVVDFFNRSLEVVQNTASERDQIIDVTDLRNEYHTLIMSLDPEDEDFAEKLAKLEHKADQARQRFSEDMINKIAASRSE